MDGRQQARPSGFITITAWLFIILSGFVILTLLLQAVMIGVLSSTAPMQEAMQASAHAGNMPGISRWIMTHLTLFNLLMLFLSSAVFVLSIGLLKRRNWARIGLMVVMAFGIVLSLVSLALQIKFFYGSVPVTSNSASQMQNEFMQIQKRMIMFSAFLTILFAALFSWIIMRLSSAKYRAEFVNQFKRELNSRSLRR